MKQLKTIVLLFTISIVTYGQEIESYDFSFSGLFIPSDTGYFDRNNKDKSAGQDETYSKEANKIEHISTYRSGNARHHEEKREKLKKDFEIENTINQLDSLFRLTEFKFTISPSIINSIKDDKVLNSNFKIKESDIDKFFSNGDTIILKLKDIKQHKSEERSRHYGMYEQDGIYKFYLMIKLPNQDSIIYSFNGNIYDSVETGNIKNWLPVFLVYNQRKIFPTTPMKKYFTTENLKGILRRFILWTKES